MSIHSLELNKIHNIILEKKTHALSCSISLKTTGHVVPKVKGHLYEKSLGLTRGVAINRLN